jgi:hypothetical protein
MHIVTGVSPTANKEALEGSGTGKKFACHPWPWVMLKSAPDETTCISCIVNVRVAVPI